MPKTKVAKDNRISGTTFAKPGAKTNAGGSQPVGGTTGTVAKRPR